MAEEIDDNEFFQQDFTTASEWEVFNARLDEIFHDWKLPYQQLGDPLGPDELFQAEWDVQSETIFFADVELIVSHYCVKVKSAEEEEEVDAVEVGVNNGDESLSIKPLSTSTTVDLMSLQNTFSIADCSDFSHIHPLAVWYGLRSFVVIETVAASIVNESQFKVLLSSAGITAAETDTKVPVFVRVMQRNLNVFLGVCEYPSTRINFDIVALETTPPTCKYLSGLLTIFKGKIQGNYIQPVTASVRLTYSVKEFVSTGYSIKAKIPFSLDSEEEREDVSSIGGTKFFALPYGVSIDPVSEIILNTTWSEIAENVIVDSATYSDLNPLQAPEWFIRANFNTQPIYYLTEAVQEFLKLSENLRLLSNVVGSSYDFGSNQNLDAANPLVSLTKKEIFSFSSVLSGGNGRRKEAKKIEGAIKNEELMQMLYYLFPDAEADALFPYGETSSDDFDPLRIKSALPDSLVARLSTLLATCNSYFGGINAVGQLWAEFTQEVRYRVERCIQIPGVNPGFPDSRTSLLHQKLQLLNICMERRRLREGGLPFAMDSKKLGQPQIDESEGEDEFYDCATDDEQETDPTAPWNKPTGRLERLDNLTLIESDDELYVPVTQEPVPKTEDQLEDDAEVMLKLGPGSELCTQMMSASLLSDMASFKAANPNGKLEDFIRWYSPRDWIEEADENGLVQGHLSQRMSIPGNTWLTVWEQAKPVPAKRQKRLFDDTKEAEKILHFFETRTIGQICQLNMASLYHATVLKLKDEVSERYFTDDLKSLFDKILTTLCKISRENWNADPTMTHQIPSLRKWTSLLHEITVLESHIIQSKSLVRKGLCVDDAVMLARLLKGLEVRLDGAAKSESAANLLRLFEEERLTREFTVESDPSLPEPVRKEYVLRVSGKTTDRGVGGPQFLRAILDKHMRLCGAFSENTTFV